MSSTSTNKQPLLIDRLLHSVADTNNAFNNGNDIIGTNTAKLLVDSTTADGALIEDIYSIARGTTPHQINLYVSTASDFLRPEQSFFCGTFQSAVTATEITRWTNMPLTLTPVPVLGTEVKNRAFYVPKGLALWVARNSDTNVTDGPLVFCQGGWY